MDWKSRFNLGIYLFQVLGDFLNQPRFERLESGEKEIYSNKPDFLSVAVFPPCPCSFLRLGESPGRKQCAGYRKDRRVFANSHAQNT